MSRLGALGLLGLLGALGALTPTQAAGGACGDLVTMRADWRRLLESAGHAPAPRGYPFQDCFASAAERSELPIHLLIGVAWGESAFDPHARSPKNAVGVMQIRWPGTARDLGFESIASLEDPCRNIEAGARYLRWLLDGVDGDPVLALASYNHGPGAIAGQDRNLNDHARGYVCYIYDKTLRVLAGARPGTKRLILRLGRFTDYGMAKSNLASYGRRVRLRDGIDLPLEIQHVPGSGYELWVRCSDEAQWSREHARYEQITGFVPN
jgi:hypothetical protein